MNWAKKIIANREERRSKLIKEKKVNAIILFICDLVEIFIPILIVLFCIACIIYMSLQSEVEGMDIILDFIIASVAGILLAVSLVNKALSDRWKYIVTGSIFTLACTVGFIIVMIIALKQRDGSAARWISFVSLIISAIDELIDYTKFQLGYVFKRNDEKKEEIKKIEEGSGFDKRLNSKNNK